MYIRDKSRIYTGPKHSVAFGTLRVQVLSPELRAAPRDPYFNELKMPKREMTDAVSIRLRMTAVDLCFCRDENRRP
jgi:hypothetical protein